MAVRTILSTLSGLTQAGLLAGAWSRRAAGPARSGSSAGPEGLRAPRERPYAQGGVEPPLEEVLRDPLVQSVMRADQWEPAEVRRLLKSKQKPLVA